jgi:hypothetical protein
VSSFRENFLILVSDNLQVIELPVGVMQENIKIGDPVKLKLELDIKRAESDIKKFQSIQEGLLQEFTSQ